LNEVVGPVDGGVAQRQSGYVTFLVDLEAAAPEVGAIMDDSSSEDSAVGDRQLGEDPVAGVEGVTG
jgi:hypothetical protein